jgi:drug/metabolite transporter (DMT)-like permease
MFLAIIFAILVGFGNATTAFYTKLGGGHFSAHTILFALFAIPFFVLILYEVIFRTKHLPTLFHSECYLLNIARAASNVIAWFAYAIALQYTSLPTALILYFSFPLMVPLLEKIWHHVHLGWKTWLGIIIGFIGTVIVVNPTEFSPGALLALLSGVMIAVDISLVNLIVEKDKGSKVVFQFFLFCFLIGTLVLCVMVLWKGGEFAVPNRFLLLWIGLAYLVTQCFVTLAQKHIPARIVAPIYYTAIIGAVCYQYFYFHEPVRGLTFIGMGLIILGAILVVILCPVNVIDEREMKSAKKWLKERK